MTFKPRNEVRRAEIVSNWEVTDAADRAQREAFALEAARRSNEKMALKTPAPDAWQVI